MEAKAHQQVTAALLSYCRGIDRLDASAVLAAFHSGAELRDYGPEPMTVEAFTEYALPALERRFTATQHRISNTSIEVLSGGNRALVETYVLAFHATGDGDEPAKLHTFNGRYIDHFEQRDGRWLIADRTLRVDWSRVETIVEPMGGSWIASGRAGSSDPIYDR